MKTIRRLGLRWLLPPVLTAGSGLMIWYAWAQDQMARTRYWYVSDLPPHPIGTLAAGLNLPAVIVGWVLNIWLPTRAIEVIFGLVLLVQWWLMGMWADRELGLGRYLGRTRAPLSERTLTLTCAVTAVLMLGIALAERSFNPKLVGLFWVLLLPMSFVTWVIRWRRRYWGRK